MKLRWSFPSPLFGNSHRIGFGDWQDEPSSASASLPYQPAPSLDRFTNVQMAEISARWIPAAIRRRQFDMAARDARDAAHYARLAIENGEV